MWHVQVAGSNSPGAGSTLPLHTGALVSSAGAPYDAAAAAAAASTSGATGVGAAAGAAAMPVAAAVTHSLRSALSGPVVPSLLPVPPSGPAPLQRAPSLRTAQQQQQSSQAVASLAVSPAPHQPPQQRQELQQQSSQAVASLAVSPAPHQPPQQRQELLQQQQQAARQSEPFEATTTATPSITSSAQHARVEPAAAAGLVSAAWKGTQQELQPSSVTQSHAPHQPVQYHQQQQQQQQQQQGPYPNQEPAPPTTQEAQEQLATVFASAPRFPGRPAANAAVAPVGSDAPAFDLSRRSFAAGSGQAAADAAPQHPADSPRVDAGVDRAAPVSQLGPALEQLMHSPAEGGTPRVSS